MAKRPLLRPHQQQVQITGEEWDFIAEILSDIDKPWPDWACEIDYRVMAARGEGLSRRKNAERWQRSERFARVMAGGE